MHEFQTSFYVNGQYAQTTRETAAEAIADVEAAGEGSVVKFALYPNLPGCEPAYRHSSLALWTYNNKVWTAMSIHSGSSVPMGEEKPH